MRFRGILRGRDAGGLERWLKDAQDSGIYAMQRFVRTLRSDFDAVRNAVTEPWSNGVTEGQISRLKTLKRAMYGRAGCELLRARMLRFSPAAITESEAGPILRNRHHPKGAVSDRENNTWLRAVFADSIYNRLAAMRACFLFGLTLIIVRRTAGATGFIVHAAQVGGREVARLARPVASPVQGLRGTARSLRGDGHPGHDPPHAASPRPPEPQTPTRAMTSKSGCQARRGRSCGWWAPWQASSPPGRCFPARSAASRWLNPIRALTCRTGASTAAAARATTKGASGAA